MFDFLRDRRYDDLKAVLRKGEGLIEVLVFAYIYGITWARYYRDLSTFAFYGRGRFVIIGLYAFILILLFIQSEGIKFGSRKTFELIIAQSISLGLCNFITYFQLSMLSAKMVPINAMLVLYIIEIVGTVIFCNIYTTIYYHFQAPWDMVMIYGMEESFHVKHKLEKRRDKYRIKASIPSKLGFDKLTEEITSGKYNAVVLADVSGTLRNDLLKFCYLKNIRVYVVPKISDIIVRGGRNIDLFDTPLLRVKSGGLTREQRFIKRTMDIVLCLIALIPAIPIMLMIIIAIKLEDGGSIFFTQTRLTRGVREFKIIKFRSMIEDAEKDGAKKAVVDDDRVTKVGKFIRATRLDELPQIFNILAGDMSIVGPRPERIENVEEYMETIPEFRFRTKVKAGLTGYAQVYGKYNTTPYDKLRLDLMYIENYSVLLDLKLIFMTLQIILNKESTEGF